MTGWQPIETAPREGGVLLYGQLAGETTGKTGRAFICIGRFDGVGDYAGFDWGCDNTDGYAVWCAATHWMPLPPAPDRLQGEDEAV